MAITVNFLESLGVDGDTAKKIFAERGAEIESERTKLTAVTAELEEKKRAFDDLTEEYNKLCEASKSGEDWHARFDELVAEKEAKEKAAKDEAEMREKKQATERRFADALGERKFYNDPTREYYLGKFEEALSSKEYEGASDKEVLSSLVKDDATAFKAVAGVKIPSGDSGASGGNFEEAKARAIMGLPAK